MDRSTLQIITLRVQKRAVAPHCALGTRVTGTSGGKHSHTCGTLRFESDVAEEAQVLVVQVGDGPEAGTVGTLRKLGTGNRV